MSKQFHVGLTPEAEATVQALQELPPAILAGLTKAMEYENALTVEHIQRDYLSFPKDGPSTPIGCRVQSSQLRGSLRAGNPVVAGQRVESSIGSKVEYALYMEEGTRPHKIEAKGGALQFVIGDRILYRKSVNHPGTEARHMVANGINDRLDDYAEAFSEVIVKAFQK